MLRPGATAVVAHSGRPIEPHDLWGAWSMEPLVVVGLAAAAVAYARGRRPSRPGRRPWRTWCFAGAVAALVLGLVSPLDALSASLASAHMVQHVLLVLVAAPLLALSRPGTALLRGSPSVVRRAAGRWRRRLGPVRAVAGQPTTVWLAHVVVLWTWHASVPYGAALRHEAVHVAEHATFLVTALLFWRVVLGGRPAERVSPGVGVLLVFAMALQGVLLSALLTFARAPWYEGYASTTEAWGLTHLADQQLAGVIMWVPAGLVYLAAGLGLLVSWLAEPDDGSEPRPVAVRPGLGSGRSAASPSS